MVATITTLFISLVVGALGVEVREALCAGLRRRTASSPTSLSIAVSLLGVFVFLLAAYYGC